MMSPSESLRRRAVGGSFSEGGAGAAAHAASGGVGTPVDAGGSGDGGDAGGGGGAFECNVCLEGASDPVVTRCGHLFWCVHMCTGASTRAGVCFWGRHIYSRVPLFAQLAVLVSREYHARLPFLLSVRRFVCAQWLDAGHGECPVCKAGVTRENVTPIYGRGGAASDPRCGDAACH